LVGLLCVRVRWIWGWVGEVGKRKVGRAPG
jgi:hypothetical protein